LTVIGLSLAAALILASSAVLQQRAATRIGPGGPACAIPGIGLLLALVRDPWWLAGWVANVCGFFVEGAALYRGSVAVVQPLVVTQLLFALALGALGSGRRMPAGAWWAAAAVCAGLGVLLVVRGASPTTSHLDDARLVATIVVLVGAAGTLVALSVGRSAATKAALLGVAAGFFFALTAVLLKRAAGLLVDAGPFALVRAWYVYALAASTLCGMLIGQTAFATGPFATALTGMNITNPVVSYLLAVLVYGMPAPTGSGRLAGVLLAGLLVAAGVTGLARRLPAHHHPQPDGLSHPDGVSAHPTPAGLPGQHPTPAGVPGQHPTPAGVPGQHPTPAGVPGQHSVSAGLPGQHHAHAAGQPDQPDQAEPPGRGGRARGPRAGRPRLTGERRGGDASGRERRWVGWSGWARSQASRRTSV
jgi:hypothetical protein